MAHPAADSFPVLAGDEQSPPMAGPDASHSASPPASAAQLADDLAASGFSPDRVSCPALLTQLRRCEEQRVDTLICCGLDSDPLLPVNQRTAVESSGEVLAGLTLLATLIGPRKTMLVGEADVVSRCRSRQRTSGRSCGSFRAVPLRGSYPLTDARLLVGTLLRRKIGPAELPTAARAVVLDAVAAADIGYRIRAGTLDPFTRLGVRNHVEHSVRLLRVPRGSTIASMLKNLGVPGDHVEIRQGDFLRDWFVPPSATLGNGELTFHLTPPTQPEPSEPCIRCAWCVEACPARIQPAGLLEAAQLDDMDSAERFGLRACIECGICSYVCPSHLPLLRSIRGLLGRPRGEAR